MSDDAAADLLKVAVRALQLPTPEQVAKGGYHLVGVTRIADSLDAVKAVAAARLKWARDIIRKKGLLSEASRGLVDRLEFLSYGEYLEAQHRVRSILDRDQRVKNLAAKREHDEWHASEARWKADALRDDKAEHEARERRRALEYKGEGVYQKIPFKPSISRHTKTPFIAKVVEPELPEVVLARIYNPDRHTADLDGYLNYLWLVARPLREFLNRKIDVYISEVDRQRHTYVVGRTGSGKTELLKALVYGYIQRPRRESLIIIDPHGDVAEQIAKWPEVAGDDLVYINPLLSDNHTITFNPYDIQDRSDKNVNGMTQELLAALDVIVREAGHSGMSANMETVLEPCIAVLLRRPGSTMADLQMFMNEAVNDKYVRLGLKAPNPTHQYFFKELFHTRHYDSTRAAIQTKIQTLLNSDYLQRILVGKSTFNLEELADAGKIIVFGLTSGPAKKAMPVFGSLILASLLGIALRRYNQPEHLRVPVHAFIDECHHFLTPSVKEMLTGTRKYALHLTLCQQSYGQEMQPDMKKAIENPSIKISGQSEGSTVETMGKLLKVGTSELEQLKVGQFYVRSGTRPPVKLYVPPLRLGSSVAVDKDVWQAVIATQLERYYRPLGDPIPIAAAIAEDAARPSGGDEPPPADQPDHLILR
jgi:energy-coupling factor transporter ATP-binding protein EcfA2